MNSLSMSSRVSFYVLHFSRLTSKHGFHCRWNCNASALKPQVETAVNCVKIMTKNMSNPPERGTNVNILKSDQIYHKFSPCKMLHKLYEEEFSLHIFVKVLNAVRLEIIRTGTSVNLRNDSKFTHLCESFEMNCYKCSPYLLISALRSFLALDIALESETVEIIGRTVLHKIDRFDGNDMIEFLLLLCGRSNVTETQQRIVDIMMQEIPKKLHDFKSGSSVFKLLKVFGQFDKKKSMRLDVRMAELVKDFSPHYLCKLLYFLAERESRNKTLLYAISNCMQSFEDKPNLKQTVDVLYALNSLNYPDTNLLLYLTDGRSSEISSTDQPSLMSSLLTVCGHLRWRHDELLEACGEWILKNSHLCTSREFASYILTTAALNYVPSDTMLKHLLSCLKEFKIAATVWLDVVWSLAVLGCTDKEMLLRVFMKDFYEPLLDGADFRVMSNKLKLMNLKSVLKNKHPECVFSCDLFLDSVEVPKSSEIESSKRSVIDALSNFVPLGKYMYVNQCTDMGITIDAEFVIDEKGKPLPLSECGSKINSLMLVETLPPGARRVAVLVLTHKDFTLNELCVTGIISLTTELLKNQGYLVVQIPFTEFSENINIVKKTHYLQTKIATSTEYIAIKEKEKIYLSGNFLKTSQQLKRHTIYRKKLWKPSNVLLQKRKCKKIVK